MWLVDVSEAEDEYLRRKAVLLHLEKVKIL
jgi:hypothetical protein